MFAKNEREKILLVFCDWTGGIGNSPFGPLHGWILFKFATNSIQAEIDIKDLIEL